MSLHTLSVAELAAGLRQKQFSATELARHFIARSEAHNGLLNGYITFTPERALADAAAAVGAFPLASADVAMLLTLPPGAFTVEVAAVGAARGESRMVMNAGSVSRYAV